MLTNCLAECAHLTVNVSEIERYICRKSSFFHTPLHLTPPLGGFPSEHRHPVCMKKLEWCGYQMVKKFRRYLYSFWRNSRTWQTDGRTDGHRVTATAALCIASHGKNESSMFYIGPRCIVDGTLWMLSLAAMLVNRRTLLCYARLMAWSACPSVCCLSVVCIVAASYSNGWTFRQYFWTF